MVGIRDEQRTGGRYYDSAWERELRCERGDDAVGGYDADAVVVGVTDEDAAIAGYGDSGGCVDLGGGGWAAVAGEALDAVACDGGDDAVGDAAQAMVGAVADQQGAGGVDGESRGRIEGCCCGDASIPEVACLTVARDGCDIAVDDGTDALVACVCDVECAVGTDGNGLRSVQFSSGCRAAVSSKALHTAPCNHEPSAAKRGLKDLVARGVRDVEVAGGVIRDAIWKQQRWSSLGGQLRHNA